MNIYVLRGCELSGLVAGKGVALRVMEGERDLMAVVVLRWGAAQRNKCCD